ncbi:MAG: hypothetical protein COT25_01840 [Candidatus Kerfeldbacteria bacterium CG08_land_8_20_14_0_20_42_7]|uniref:Uncharacterized protein n=1 Tax=Candidatus Kerfeldbacteria bacterium CG08_land_8_20_14_0_20_42_7 TaxID=2014245 RepID=A0A2H0YTR2_9BACT|nr:MAG: hypothetical protein COT25_01840 [Candidatus Kerfeldbacteria bacterium CG08_land_8_20_14_0_20_42_7]
MQVKKIIYYIAATFLGFLLSLLLHIAIESIYLQLSSGVPHWHSLFGVGLDALPIWLTCLLATGGILFGYWLGVVWWRIVYIEHRLWRKKKTQ